LFQSEKATAAILTFLKTTGVGKIPGEEGFVGYGEGRDGQEEDDWDEDSSRVVFLGDEMHEFLLFFFVFFVITAVLGAEGAIVDSFVAVDGN
jgi:hypothetical protein